MDQNAHNLIVRNDQKTIPTAIQIYSISGQQVMEDSNPRLSNEINTSSMGSVFIVSITDETGIYSKTFVNR